MFLNPTMLAGLAGAMIPLVLHLLARARYQNVQWGAMMFLMEDGERRSVRERLREWSLLAVRMGIVGLLAIALARPVIAPTGAMVEGPSSTVIVLDRSGSMGIAQNGPARLESAIRAAAAVIANLDPGDEASLVCVPPLPTGNVGPMTDLRRIGLSLNDITTSAARADLQIAMDEAATILAQSRAAFKHVVLITDRQDTSWKGFTSEQSADLRRRLASVGPSPASFTLVPIGGQEIGNVSVEAVQVANPPVIRGVPAEIEVHLRNYDTVPSAAIPLSIQLLGQQPSRELHHTTIHLDAGATAVVRCSVTFEEAGSAFILARIATRGFIPDDTMDAGIEVTEPISVLVVSGDERETPGEGLNSESDLLRLALEPYEFAGRIGPDMAKVDVVSSDGWPELDRTRHQIVVLANVPRLAERQVQQLEQFVYGGGGLIIAPGNLARVDEYNAMMWRDGNGMLPAQLLAPTPADGSLETTLLGLDLGHPIFRFLQGRDEPIPRVVVHRYFPIRPGSATERALGQYASGQPFMMENSYGKGRIILFTTPLDDDWSRLPWSNIFLPLLQSSVRYLAAGVLPDRNLWINQPIVAMIDDPVELHGSGTAPGNRPFVVDLVRVGDSYEARFTGTNRPGQYSLRVETRRGIRHLRFSVRAPRDESDVTSVSSERFAALQRELGFTVREPEPAAIASAVADARRRWELWPWLLGAVIVLGVFELGLARRWAAEEERGIA